MPLLGLLALSTTAFLTILTETMPAAVMPAMAESLQQSSAGIGLLVSVYALASAAAAIPIVALARALPRKPLYIGLVLSFAIANGVTALSTPYALTVSSRVVAGLTAGIIWPVICGYSISNTIQQRQRVVVLCRREGGNDYGQTTAFCTTTHQ